MGQLDGFLLKARLALVIARLISVHAYLERIALICQDQEQTLVDLFQEFLQRIEMLLVHPATLILARIDYNKLASDRVQQASCRGAQRNLTKAVHALERLLLKTDVFPRARPGGEVYDFVDGIIPEPYRSAASVNIVLFRVIAV